MSRKIHEMVDNLCIAEDSKNEDITSNIYIDIFKVIAKLTLDETFRNAHLEFLQKNISLFN